MKLQKRGIFIPFGYKLDIEMLVLNHEDWTRHEISSMYINIVAMLMIYNSKMHLEQIDSLLIVTY